MYAKKHPSYVNENIKFNHQDKYLLTMEKESH